MIFSLIYFYNQDVTIERKKIEKGSIRVLKLELLPYFSYEIIPFKDVEVVLLNMINIILLLL